MNKETSKLIEELANKLGTTTEYLWSILIHQARINAIINLFQLLILVIVGFALYKAHQYFKGEDKDGYERYTEGTTFVMVMASITYCVLLIFAFCSIGDTVNGFINPEYWALNEVMSLLK